MIRPPLVPGRLQILDAEHVAFSLKSVGSDGTYQIILSPEELLEKLAARVPPRDSSRRAGAAGNPRVRFRAGEWVETRQLLLLR